MGKKPFVYESSSEEEEKEVEKPIEPGERKVVVTGCNKGVGFGIVEELCQ